MFDTILIANRGEIACRIARTCRRLGVRTIGVYSEADAAARHVVECDEARLLGPAPARDSYLRGERILDLALESGAQAIHPGYGFLAENPGFAEACEAAGLVFIGPSAAAIHAMGLKHAAKAIMAGAGVPLLPGYADEEQDAATLESAAAEIGYPLLIKPSAGGGGKGMRLVESPAQLEDAVAAARREAAAAFGDDRVLLEKYLIRPRHIEVQVFGDHFGNIIHLFERDCSVQRRHQKIIEEAPAPGISEPRRRAMGETAVTAAKAIAYVGAGTVEFIVDRNGAFYFMEMNTRLQVEHPVTEMITGQDLVEWQLRVAAGQALPCAQEALTLNGHAFEARIYAEDPDRDFLPAVGRLNHLSTPAESPQVRIDSSVLQGDDIGTHYDPMIAKLIVWDQDRDSALRRLRLALADYQVVGVTTNLRLLNALAAHPAFASAELDTGFIQHHSAALFPPREPVSNNVLALAVLGELLRIDRQAAERARRSGDPSSPWHSTSGWRLNADGHHTLHFHDGERRVSVTAHYGDGDYLLELPGGSLRVRGELFPGGEIRADLGGWRLRATVVRQHAEITVLSQSGSQRLTVYNPLTEGMEAEVPTGSLAAPMPGTIAQILVKEGEAVKKGAPLVVMEAMKMELTVSAPEAGVVERIHYAAGDQVAEGMALLTLG